MEKIFGLGKTDTDARFATIAAAAGLRFSPRACKHFQHSAMRENIDSIRVFDESENHRVVCSAIGVHVRHATMAVCWVGAKRDGFCACVHAPLSGVGVFFVALV